MDTPVEIDTFLAHGQILQAAPNITMEIIHAPGHSPGSLNILFQEAGIFFTADSIPVVNDIPNYDSFTDLNQTLKKIRTKKMFKHFSPPGNML